MKKIISIFLSICFVMLVSNITILAMPNDNTKDIKNVTSYEEINDIDELVKLGINQYKSTPHMCSNLNDDYVLNVKQLLKETDYNNGETEKEFAQNSIVITDKQGTPLTLDQVFYKYGNGDVSTNVDGIYVVTTIYMTERFEPGFPDSYLYRVDKVVTDITRSGSVWVVGGSHSYSSRLGLVFKSQNISPLQSLSKQSFTLYGDGNFYDGVPDQMDGFGDWRATTHLGLSNGKTISLEAIIDTIYT